MIKFLNRWAVGIVVGLVTFPAVMVFGPNILLALILGLIWGSSLCIDDWRSGEW